MPVLTSPPGPARKQEELMGDQFCSVEFT